jgi:hypothetical protein
VRTRRKYSAQVTNGCTVLVFALLPACSGSDGRATQLVSAGDLRLQSTATPEFGIVSIRTTPGAACVMQRKGNTDPKRTLRLYADYEGTVRFSATRQSQTASAQASLDCKERGQSTTYTVDLTSPSLFSAPSPAVTTAGYKVRPPLATDPKSATQHDLISGGYPMRPDAVRSPELYDRWLRAVSQSTKIVDPALVPDPRVVHGTGSSQDVYDGPWAGGELNATVSYVGAISSFALPGITYDPVNVFRSVSFWAGIGGDSAFGGGGSLIQDGVGIDSLQGEWGPGTVLTEYHLWTEYFPLEPNDVTAITPNQNDEIYVDAYVADPSGNVNSAGVYGCFDLEDVTQKLSTHVCTAEPTDSNTVCWYDQNLYSAPCPIPFVGGTAEFALEAANQVTSDGGFQQLLALSNYGQEVLYGLGLDANGSWHDFNSDPVVTDFLYRQSDAAIVSADAVQLTWTGTGF